MLAQLKEDLAALADPHKAAVLSRFFKTGKGEYAEGDSFLGVAVPEQRKIARKYNSLSLSDAEALLVSPIHEHRLTALFILVLQFRNGDAGTKKKIFELYLRNTGRINNWDLVDSSAEHIVGAYLHGRDKALL
ncbi:DNA alkylation repair protein, partial [Candidatus Woesearchaeota archaeon CG_4_10_14_0_8_um_filter_47_5]